VELKSIKTPMLDLTDEQFIKLIRKLREERRKTRMSSIKKVAGKAKKIKESIKTHNMAKKLTPKDLEDVIEQLKGR